MVELNATLFAQIINFAVLLLILNWFYKRFVKNALEERQNRIAGALAAADKERETAEELRRQYQEQLAAARVEAQAIIDKAAKLADETREEIIAQARAEHARLLEEAKAEIAREREFALAQLKAEVITLSVSAAAKIIGRNIDAQANAALVEEFIGQLDAKKLGGWQ